MGGGGRGTSDIFEKKLLVFIKGVVVLFYIFSFL